MRLVQGIVTVCDIENLVFIQPNSTWSCALFTATIEEISAFKFSFVAAVALNGRCVDAGSLSCFKSNIFHCVFASQVFPFYERIIHEFKHS